MPTPHAMRLLPVDSSNIAAIGYNPHDMVLAVQFRSGATYHYGGVPAAVWMNLLTAGSKGQYLNQHVIGAYEATKQDDSPQPS